MAKKVTRIGQGFGNNFQQKRNNHRITSIGNSVNTRPKNKKKRASFKKYRGQGR